MSTQKRLKTAQLSLRIDPSLKQVADRAASADHRSLTSLIEKLLMDYLRAKGYLPVQDIKSVDDENTGEAADAVYVKVPS